MIISAPNQARVDVLQAISRRIHGQRRNTSLDRAPPNRPRILGHNSAMKPTPNLPQAHAWTLEDFHGRRELRKSSDKPGAGVRADWKSLRLPDGANSLRNQPLGRAVGKEIRTAVDATAGLGYDTYALALLGVEVLALERDANVFALLAEELSRAKNDTQLCAAAARIQIEHANAHQRLPTLRAKVGFTLGLFTAREFILPDMILLDPMFGGERGAAKPSKEIQALAATVGADADADSLLDMAIASATRRVIVKRSRLAPPLSGRAPDWTIKGKLLRFDVYRAGAR